MTPGDTAPAPDAAPVHVEHIPALFDDVPAVVVFLPLSEVAHVLIKRVM